MATLNYTTNTEGQHETDTLIWTIPNFINVMEKKITRELRTDKSYDHVMVDLDKNKFYLKIQLLGYNNDIIEIYYLSKNPVFVKCLLSKFITNFQERSIVSEDYHKIAGNKWQYLTTFFKRDQMNAVDFFLLSDGRLRLKFKFVMYKDIEIEGSIATATQLRNDFERLLNSELFSDVTIKSTEGKEYKAHKAILISRSVVLKANFEHNTTECYTNVIESPLDSETLQDVLTFIYSDRSPRVNAIPEKLLVAAEYYQLCGLKRLCEEVLHKRLTVDNVIETLQLADLYSAQTLKQLTLDFIKEGQAKYLTMTESWANLKSVELSKTIYEHMIDGLEADIK